MAALILLRRSIYRNWICARSTVRRISSSSSSSASSSPRPWLLLGDRLEDEHKTYNRVAGFDFFGHYPVEDIGVDKLLYKFYSLADRKLKVYNKRSRVKDAVVVGSSHGWLALYKRRRDLYKRRHENDTGFYMFLYNPVSERQVNLPSVETLSTPKSCTSFGPFSINKMYRPKKVILSSSPDDNDEECRAIMSYGPEDRLAYCCPGTSKHWIPMDDSHHENDPINELLIRTGYATPGIYEDFVYSATKKQLFCTTKFESFECWDISDPLYPKMNWKKIPGDGLDYDDDNYPFPVRRCLPLSRWLLGNNGLWRTWKYLVYAEKSNRLLLVRRIVKIGDGPYETLGFHVHEIMVGDPAKKGKLRYMDSGDLYDTAFFIGSTGHGFVIERDEVYKYGAKPNCIYFTDPKELTPSPWAKHPSSYGGHDFGIFDYRYKVFKHKIYAHDVRSIRRIEPTPTWFTPSSPSEEN